METSVPPSHFKTKRQLKIWEKQQQENAAKRLNRNLYANQSPFRYAERIYKSRIPTPEFKDIVDFSNIENNTKENQENIVQVELKHDLRQLSNVFGESDDKWNNRKLKAFVMTNVPGLIVISNSFTPAAQRRLVKHCLSDYAKPPHTSNLDGHYYVPADGIWPLYEKEKKGELRLGDTDFYVPTKTIVQEESDIYPSDQQKNDDDDAQSSVSSMFSDINKPANLLSPTKLVKKQRWVTLGYHYHWGTKEYDLERPVPIPDDVSRIVKAVVTATEDIGCEDAQTPWKNTYKGCNFKPEAGIINYYQLQSTLMGHVDRSEIDMDSPLISLSLGHSCIFLIGSNTKDTKPIPLRLNSGDIIIVTAVARKSYHGVPRILEGTLPEYMSSKGTYDDSPDWTIYGDYMSTSRINLSIRQVFPNA